MPCHVKRRPAAAKLHLLEAAAARSPPCQRADSSRGSRPPACCRASCKPHSLLSARLPLLQPGLPPQAPRAALPTVLLPQAGLLLPLLAAWHSALQMAGTRLGPQQAAGRTLHTGSWRQLAATSVSTPAHLALVGLLQCLPRLLVDHSQHASNALAHNLAAGGGTRGGAGRQVDSV